MASFKSILENDSFTIDNLWLSLDKIINDTIDDSTSFPAYSVLKSHLLVISDAYLDLGTEDGERISEGLRDLVRREHFPSINIDDHWVWLRYPVTAGNNINQSLPNGIFTRLTNTNHNSSHSIAWFNSLKSAMESAALACFHYTQP